ncbi:hypothetical protein EGW08_022632 [Elysia chlorotica]|uniref:RanBP2-type domain-containing protein n=1 Tax=Elysia chlorotica TaxID=188477 RepID=A0A3S1B1G5_ELYCH|nr:hypothetical protein EGW08_022632 [Elysia chlorotica]
MEALQQVRLLYKQRYQQQGLAFLSDQHTYQLDSKIQRLIEIAIKEVPSVILFQTPDYLNMFERALKIHIKATSDLTALAKAYESLEKYFLQLVEQPWKREFKKIKLYGGFYRTRIKSALPEAESIFQQAGYSLQLDKQILILEHPVEVENALLLAFDNRLCREQIQIITEHYEVVKGLSVSLDQAATEILYGDRSRGRPNMSTGLQVNLQPYVGVDKTKVHLPLSCSSGVPHIPKREPIERASTMRFLPPEETMDPMIDLRNRRIERQPDHFEGTVEEHILRSLQAVGQLPYTPQNIDTISSKNGQVDSEEWEQYHQLQMLHKGDKNGMFTNENPFTNSALHNPALTPACVYPYPASTVAGMQKASISESYDEGIEKDYPMSKSSRDMSARYPSLSMKSGLQQGGIVNNKLPSSSLQPSLADQGYNTAYGTNGQTTIPNLANVSQMLHQQPQQGFRNVICADGVNSAPAGPPPIPPRALKPDYGPKGHAHVPQEVLAYSSSLTSPHQTCDNSTPVLNSNPKCHATGAVGANFQESSVISSCSSSVPMMSPTISQSGPILRRDRQHAVVGKSSSLKYNIGATNGGNAAPSLLQQSHRNRGARSMDLSGLGWECHTCTTRNLSSDKVCSVCSTSRLKLPLTVGNGVPSEPANNGLVQGTSKKSCPACTLENEPDRTHCSLCEGPLEEPYTYV